MAIEFKQKLDYTKRATVMVAQSDKTEFSNLKPQGMYDWQFFQELLRVYKAQDQLESKAA